MVLLTVKAATVQLEDVIQKLPMVEAPHKPVSRSASPEPKIGTQSTEENVPFKIISMPGKGIGMVALRKIFPGEIIMSEEPLIVVPDKIFEDAEKTEKYIDKKIENMSAEKIQQFLSLTDCRNPEEPSYPGIFYTNDMNYDGDAALFPIMARVNHSCCANSEFVSRSDLGVQRLVANYTIEAGEEITINYMPATGEASDKREVRQSYMREWYGFRCTCQVCTLQDDELEENEKIREEIKELQAQGIENLDLDELQLLLSRLFEIFVKASYVLEILTVAYSKAECGISRYLTGVRAMALSIDVYGQDAVQTAEWKELISADDFKIAEISSRWF